MQDGLKQQSLATASGYWPLIRYNPMLRQTDQNPFVLDSPRPRKQLKDYAYNELRYKMLQRTQPEKADKMMQLAQQVVNQKWEIYERMATQTGSDFHPDASFID